MSELLERLSSRKISRKEFDREKEELLLSDRRQAAATAAADPEEARRRGADGSQPGMTVESGEARRHGLKGIGGSRPGAGGMTGQSESGGTGKPDGRFGAVPTKHRYVSMILVFLVVLAAMRILLIRQDAGQTPDADLSAVIETADDGITEEMLRVGYTAEQADLIRERLNLAGVTAVKVDRMSAAPEAEINTVLCSPNGLEGEENQIFFTTLNGEITYIAYQDIYLYDASGIGFISTYEKARDAK
jgi:hypothetical protein